MKMWWKHYTDIICHGYSNQQLWIKLKFAIYGNHWFCTLFVEYLKHVITITSDISKCSEQGQVNAITYLI